VQERLSFCCVNETSRLSYEDKRKRRSLFFKPVVPMESPVNEQNNAGSVTAIVIGVVVVALIVIGLFLKNSNAPVEVTPVNPTPAVDTVPSTNPEPTPAPEPTSTVPAVGTTTTPAVVQPPVKQTAAPYKDGTFTATGVYDSPAGSEDLGVTLTLKDGVVTDSALQLMATQRMSVRFQQRFESGYKAAVVGKNIADLQLDAISGSSLTPIGFNDAVEKIKVQAKA
jgi:uncharacterized protein with FMN-binding domain